MTTQAEIDERLVAHGVPAGAVVFTSEPDVDHSVGNLTKTQP
jgi:hypothetical protein